ncbi:MAG: DUF421 domain-containing protein [Chitinophagales bacterium]
MDVLIDVFGLHTERLTFYQMLARAITVFFVSLFALRFFGLRTLGRQNTFDSLTTLILGAILGRAIIEAKQPFFQSLLIVFVILGFNRLLAWLTFKSRFMGKLFKSDPVQLVKDGAVNEDALRKTLITKEDVEESLRLSVNSNSIDDAKAAYLERSGEISILKKGKS